jgi:serine/threonine protein kinase
MLHLDPAAAARILADLTSESHPSEHNANRDAVGRLPPGYIFDRVLGTGGGGTVYRAFREGSDRPLALKILDYRIGFDAPAGPGASPAASRAWRELRLLEDLHVPVLPRLIDYGVHQGRLYIATEFIEGRTLDEAVSTPPSLGTVQGGGTRDAPAHRDPQASSRKPQAQLALLLAKVCDAVQRLHEHGVIHRDLKPSNIMIDAHGEPMLIDLGIAAIMDPASTPPPLGRGPGGGTPDAPAFSAIAFPTLTETGSPIGTPAYMAPEQARGERQRISTRSDVYSLGATAYRVLTGATPHDTNTTIHEAIRRVAFDEPRDPRTLEPSLPKPLAAVLSKACAREPSRRYATAAEFAADLRRWVNGEPVEAVPPGAWQRAVRWAGRHPAAVTSMLCALIALLTAIGVPAGVWWAEAQPWDIVRSENRREARLLARSGASLQTWRVQEEGEIRIATLVDRPSLWGGRQVAVLLFAGQAEQRDFSGQLCVFDVKLSVTEPAWRTPGHWGEPGFPKPPREPRETDRTYGASKGLIADIFPGNESPGQEIVVSMNQHASPSVVRVYDLRGCVLWEAWHRGSIISVVWSAESGLLVLCANDNRFRSSVPAVDERERVPQVFFALRPQPNAFPIQINRELEDSQPDGPTDAERGSAARNDAEWYLWVKRAPGAPLVDHCDVRTLYESDRDRYVATAYFVFEDDSACQWPLTADGRVSTKRTSLRFDERHGDDSPDFVEFLRVPPMDVLRPARPNE